MNKMVDDLLDQLFIGGELVFEKHPRLKHLCGIISSIVEAGSLQLSVPMRMLRGSDGIERLNDIVDTANHEAGHFLIASLNGDTLVKTYVGKSHMEVAAALGLPAGFIERISGKVEKTKKLGKHISLFKNSAFMRNLSGLLGLTEKAEEQLDDFRQYGDVVKKLFLFLGGLVAEDMLDSGKDHCKNPRIVHFSSSPRTDEEKIRNFIERLFKKHNIDVSDNAVLERYAQICKDLVDRLANFFADPRIKKITNQISLYLIEHNYLESEDLGALAMKHLEENGMTDDDLVYMRAKYNAMLVEAGEKLKEFCVLQ